MSDSVATGSFEFSLVPLAGGSPVGAMSLAKTFSGDLDATSIGQMLAVRTSVAGSAG